MAKENDSILGPSFTFRIALRQTSILNGIFPMMYSSHKDWLIQEHRKRLGIRDKKHQEEIMDIIEKYDKYVKHDTELQQLEGLDNTVIWEVPELKEHNLNLPVRFTKDPLHMHSFSLHTFIGSDPQFLHEMSLIFFDFTF